MSSAIDVETDVPSPLAALGAAAFANPYLRMPALAALRAYDRRRGAGYLRTLATYLDMHGSVADSAAGLGVHANTFRYRLERIAAVSGLDLDDADERLVCALELATATPTPTIEVSDVTEPEWAGVPEGRPVTVVALCAVGDDDRAPERLVRMVALSWNAFRTSAWSDVDERTVYSVVPVTSAASMDVVEAAVRAVADDARLALGVPVLAGIGPVADEVRHADASRALARDVLHVVLDRGADPVARLDDVRTAVVLSRLAALAPGDLDDGAVARLVAHDRDHGTDYVASLRAYLDCFGEVSAAAANRHVHVRTFRYRLRRIAEIALLDLDCPRARLAAHLTLRLREAAANGTGQPFSRHSTLAV